jgi:hypothetical protein
MSEFSKFKENVNSKLEFKRQTELGINPEQLQLAKRLDNFFSGLHEELLQKNVPLYEYRHIQEEQIVQKLLKKKTLLKPPVYEHIIVPRKETVTQYDYWRLYHRKRTPSGREQSETPTISLVMKKTGELVYSNDSYTTNDKYLVYRALSEISNSTNYDSILNVLEPSIKELLNIK